MQVIEWNGIPLTGISHDEVSRIISTQIGDEIEVVIRTDINLLSDPYGAPYPGGQAGPVPGQMINYPPYGPPNQGPGYGGQYYGQELGPPPFYPPSQAHPMMAPPPPGAMHHPPMPGPFPPMHDRAHGPQHQQQVILQHNHPVVTDEALAYDQYDKMMMPPPPPHSYGGHVPPRGHMMPPGQMAQQQPPPPHGMMPQQPHHFSQQQQQPMQPHAMMDNAYYPH